MKYNGTPQGNTTQMAAKTLIKVFWKHPCFYSVGNINIAMTEFENYDQLRCGFWDLNLEQGSGVPPGGWSSTGLSVETFDDTTITCTSTHLTSFAVLVDVSGASRKVPEAQRKALSIVSYIGCAVSLLCLIAAAILFIIYRNSLLKGMHNFIHLNLTIALALALLVFVAGIETAAKHEISCTIVAALLHYSFTCVFMWMLCEGIMLYVLLVKVFNAGLGQKKWFYLALGWGTPLPVVAIAVGIAHDQYGTNDYCWISIEKGAIWAFVAPMLVIILVNVLFLCLAIRAVYKSKANSLSTEDTTNVEVVKTVLRATLILLPLLGITWVIGILAVNEESIVFAWIFTVLNSLQGVFIFVLHVLRNGKIKDKIKSYFGKRSKYTISSTATSTTTRDGTLKSKKASSMKAKASTDVELGSISKHSLDDSKVESIVCTNPLANVAEEEYETKTAPIKLHK
ncbi:adhesion G-protein coupled receptor D1-like [Dysidea avara]|uniref:adhesion G-protein coupled receptor D1-like n=1 Tax=Dysidea avara TaxID=196820 RepID=UPI00332D466F